MSDNSAFGFGKFVPGFDFLQTLAQSAAQQGGAASPAPASGMPDWSQWVAPTLKVEEIDKRIKELKTVQFWLEQNARALAATIQALEVQKMTLDTLKGMNVQMSDLAGAFGFKGAPAPAPEAPLRGSGRGPYDDMFTRGRAAAAAAQGGMAMPQAEKPAPVEPPAAEPFTQPVSPVAEPVAAAAPAAAPEAAGTSAPVASPPDPLQWWNALTGQFQQIAASALQDAARHARSAPGAQAAATGAAPAGKGAARSPAAPRSAAKASAAGKAAAPRKSAAAKKTTTRAKPAAKAPAAPRGRKR